MQEGVSGRKTRRSSTAHRNGRHLATTCLNPGREGITRVVEHAHPCAHVFPVIVICSATDEITVNDAGFINVRA